MTLACCIARGAIQVYLLSKPTLWPYLAKKKKKKNRILIASLATAQLMFPSQDISVDSVRAELFPPNTVALPPPHIRLGIPKHSEWSPRQELV